MKILVIVTLLLNGWTLAPSRFDYIYSEPMTEEQCENAAKRFNDTRRQEDSSFAFCKEVK